MHTRQKLAEWLMHHVEHFLGEPVAGVETLTIFGSGGCLASEVLLENILMKL